MCADQLSAPDQVPYADQAPEYDQQVGEHDPMCVATIWTKYPLREVLDGYEHIVKIPMGSYDLTVSSEIKTCRHVGYTDTVIDLLGWTSDGYVTIINGPCPFDAPIIEFT